MKELKCPNKQGGWITVSAILGVPKAGGSVFVPTDLADLSAWYQFNTGITVETGVSEWADQSGNAFHLTQSTAANQPTNSSGIITFDGTDDVLGPAYFEGVLLAQPYTVYLLAKQISWADGRRIFDNYNATVILYQGDSSPDIRLYGGAVSDPNVGWTIGSFAAVAAVFNSTGSVIQVGSGGTPVTVDAGTVGGDGFTLGATNAGTFNGNIAVKETIVYGAAHDADTRADVLAYLETL